MFFGKAEAIAHRSGPQFERNLRVAVCLLLVAAVAIDLITPVNIIISVLFAIIVACTALSTSPLFLWGFAGAAASGSFLGYFGAPPPLGAPAPEVVLWNRILGLLTICGVAILASAIQARRLKLAAVANTLEQERTLLSTLVDHLPVGVLIVDQDGSPVMCNPAYVEVVPEGALPSRVAAAADRWVGYDEQGQRILPENFAGARALRGEYVSGLEFLHLQPNGEEKWTRVSGVPLRNAEGEVTGALCVVVDIDQLRRSEEHLRTLTETLEERVTERTTELLKAQDALRQSQKVESLGHVTGGLAHDFNNLLTPIVGALDMLKNSGLGGYREQRLIDGALQSAERARVLVQRLLAFARRQPLRTGPVDVSSVVAGMSELLRTTTGPRIEVEISIPPKLPPAMADRNQLEMALLNLAVNARDAMPDGGRLTISGRAASVDELHPRELPAGEYIVVGVADTGVGMDEQTLARAVDPFFSTKGIGKGSGLGLSMVHGFAAQLGGALTIESKPGLGTSVELWLPASDHEAVEEAPAKLAPITASEAGTALLVDDEEIVRLSTAEMLSDLGYSVMEASSAAQALQLIEQNTAIDLVVTDHLMPGMTGGDLARQLRQRFPEIPVLIVSGYSDLDAIAPDLKRLNKPFRPRELAVAISELKNGQEKQV